jgi:ribosomal protein S7
MSTKSIKARFLNYMITNGQKYTSEKLLLDSLKIIQKKRKKNSKSIIKLSLKSVNILLSTIQIKRRKLITSVPFFLTKSKRLSNSIKLIVKDSRLPKKNLPLGLQHNILKLSANKGDIKSKSIDIHMSAFINKNLSNYRWF